MKLPVLSPHRENTVVVIATVIALLMSTLMLIAVLVRILVSVIEMMATATSTRGFIP